MNPVGVTQMLAFLPIESIVERLHLYQELPVKTREDLMIQDMLKKELNRREAHTV
jgi:hypothetical protein